MSDDPVTEPELEPKAASSTWWCYILRNTQPRYAHLTYNGSTNDLRRRLRQHNEEITGGAKFTHGRGGGWEYYVLMTGFPNHKNALSCEWRIKHTNGKPGKRPTEHCGVRGRVNAMNHIVRLDKWTKQCVENNQDTVFDLYVADDMVQYVDLSALPANVRYRGSPAVVTA